MTNSTDHSLSFSDGPEGRVFRAIRLKNSALRAVAKRGFARAFMAIDMLFGIIIVGGITIALLGTVRHERSAQSALSDSRSALHLAEHALLNLQHGQPMPTPTADEHLTIQPATSGTAPAGFIWAKVDATVHGHRQSLIGVVPTGSIPSGTKS